MSANKPLDRIIELLAARRRGQSVQSISDQIVFATPHGSRLYGFQTESSDEDWFIVTNRHRTGALHSVIDDNDESGHSFDVVEVGWTDFLGKCSSGSHQSLEAAFSSQKIWFNDERRALIESLRVYDPAVFEKYRRTITAFSFGDFKRRRHAVRLSSNLLDIYRHGRFAPEMTFREAAMAGAMAENLAGHALKGILLAQF